MSILRYSNFRWLWLGQTLSQMGDSLTEVAIAVFALNLSNHSGLTFASILFVAQLPKIFLGWLVGGVIDRWNKRHLMIAGDVMRALLILSIPWMGTVGWARIAVVAIQFCGMFYLPAVRAILPETVPESEWNRANAIMGQSQSLVGILGYATAASLVLTVGYHATFWADCASYLICALFVGVLRLPRSVWTASTNQAEHPGFWQNLQEGWRYHRTNPVIRNLLGISAIAGLAMNGLTVLTAVAVPQLLHQPTGIYGYCLMAMALGMFAGSTLIARWGNVWFHGQWIQCGFFLAGVLCILLGWNQSLWLAYAYYFGMGAGNAAFLLPMRTWIAAETPVSFRGRVYAARGIALAVTGVISALAGGLLSNLTGIRAGLALLGGLMLAAGLLTRRLPIVRNASSDLSSVL